MVPSPPRIGSSTLNPSANSTARSDPATVIPRSIQPKRPLPSSRSSCLPVNQNTAAFQMVQKLGPFARGQVASCHTKPRSTSLGASASALTNGGDTA